MNRYGPGGDSQIRHVGPRRNLPRVSATILPSRKIVSPRRMVRTTTPVNSNPTIRAHFMPLKQFARLQRIRTRRIEQQQIGVIPDQQRCLSRGCETAPPGLPQSAPRCARTEGGARRGPARAARPASTAPRRHLPTTRGSLQRSSATARHGEWSDAIEIDSAVEHFAPQHGVLVGMTQRRRALGGDADAFEIVLREKQVVRTCLHRHVHAARAPFGRFRDAAAGADVHDVKLRAGLAREIDRARDRVELGLDRPRREEIAARVDPVSARASARVISSLSAWTATGRPRRAASRIPSRSVLSSAYAKLGKARVAHERLEADDAALGHRGHLIDRARHEPAPQTEIGDRRRFERRALRVDRVCGDRARRRIERHVEEQRAAAGRERAAAGFGAFPLGASRLVEVQVRVDEPGKYVQAGRIDFVRRAPFRSGPISTMRPSDMRMSAFTRPSGRTSVPPRTMVSITMRALQLVEKFQSGIEGRRHVVFAHILGRMMADASLAAEEQHAGRHLRGEQPSHRGRRRSTCDGPERPTARARDRASPRSAGSIATDGWSRRGSHVIVTPRRVAISSAAFDNRSTAAFAHAIGRMTHVERQQPRARARRCRRRAPPQSFRPSPQVRMS